MLPELGGNAFECPEGIKFVEIDVESGLLSTLSCPHRELVAITDRLAPNFECYNHGNLLESERTSGDAEQSLAEVTTLAQHVKPRSRSNPTHDYHLSPTATRVAVNGSGRKVLVNELR